MPPEPWERGLTRAGPERSLAAQPSALGNLYPGGTQPSVACGYARGAPRGRRPPLLQPALGKADPRWLRACGREHSSCCARMLRAWRQLLPVGAASLPPSSQLARRSWPPSHASKRAGGEDAVHSLCATGKGGVSVKSVRAAGFARAQRASGHAEAGGERGARRCSRRPQGVCRRQLQCRRAGMGRARRPDRCHRLNRGQRQGRR